MNEKIKIVKRIDCHDEKNGYYSISGHYGEQITNLQGKFIIDKILEGATLSSLCLEVSENYNIRFTQAKEDVFNFLLSLKYSRLIDFDEDYFDDVLDFDRKVYIAGEREYRQLLKEIRKNFIDYNTLYAYIHPDKKRYYNEYTIRTNSFYNKENFFFDYADDFKEMKNIIGIRGISVFDSPLVVTLIQYHGDYESLVDFYQVVEKKLISMNKYKIKLPLVDGQDNSKIIRFAEHVGFCLEARLAKEDGEKDYIIYSKLLEE